MNYIFIRFTSSPFLYANRIFARGMKEKLPFLLLIVLCLVWSILDDKLNADVL